MLCHYFGYSKQAYYRKLKTFDHFEREEYTISIVRDIRADMPKLGGVKLWSKLNANGIRVGRDELYSWLHRNDLMVKFKKKYVVTTDSSKWYRQFSNLVKDLDICRPNQVWVSDITYIETLSGFVYLSLITDAYSRKILGAFVHKNLDTEGPLKALYQAFLQVDGQVLKGLIHHSDRGCQYCSSLYTDTLRMKGIKISTTQDGSPYDNAIAERVNGILKQEWLNEEQFDGIQDVRMRIDKIVLLYNNERPHYSIGLQTPNTVFGEYEGKYRYRMY